MIALARYVMVSRYRAAAAILLMGLVPIMSWLSAGLLALVVLRNGLSDSALVVLAAVVAAAVSWQLGADIPLFTMAGVLLAAVILRAGPWSLVLMILAVWGGLTPLIIEQGVTQHFDQYVALYQTVLQQASWAEQFQLGDTPYWARRFFYEAVAFSVSMGALFALMLGRWWQASLYNPGGFQREIHALRLPPMAVLVCVLLLVLGYSRNAMMPLFLVWLMPLVIVAIGIVHSIVMMRELSGQWLVMFYLALLFLGSIMIVPMVILVVLDSFFDVRRFFVAAQ